MVMAQVISELLEPYYKNEVKDKVFIAKISFIHMQTKLVLHMKSFAFNLEMAYCHHKL